MIAPGEVVVLAERNGVRLVVENDGRTVYAYLWGQAGILAHVWLENLCSQHHPADNGIAPQNQPPMEKQLIRRRPHLAALTGTYVSSIESFLINDEFGPLAILKAGEHPGMCALADSDGPTARQFKDDVLARIRQ